MEQALRPGPPTDCPYAFLDANSLNPAHLLGLHTLKRNSDHVAVLLSWMRVLGRARTRAMVATASRSWRPMTWALSHEHPRNGLADGPFPFEGPNVKLT